MSDQHHQPPYVPMAAPTDVRQARPWPVTFAAAMLVVAAVLVFIGLSASVVARYHAVPSTTDVSGGYMIGYLGGGLCIALVFVAILITLAVLNLRGNNVGRIITWVSMPLVLCCQAGSSMPALRRDAQTTTEAIWGIVASGMTVLQIGVVLLIVVLLALPASNAFFKRKAPGPLH